MARAFPWLRTFQSGEVSELLLARTDLPVYQTGLRTCRRWLVQMEGGATRCPGWRFVGAPKHADRTARLIDFRFSTEQVYVLEFGHEYIRFYRNGVLITEAPERITNGTFDTDISGWTVISGAPQWDAATQSCRFSTFDLQVTDHIEQVVTIPAEHVGQPHKLRFTATPSGITGATTGVIVIVGTTSGGGEYLFTSRGPGDHTITFTPTQTTIYVRLAHNGAFPGPTRDILLDNVSLTLETAAPVEVATPYQEGDLAKLSVTQKADVLFIDCAGYAPRRLIRLAHTEWHLQEIVFFDGPYLPENTNDGWTLVADGPGPNVTLTAAGSGFAPFQAGHVGSIWRLTFGADTSHVRITAVTDSTHATALVVDRVDDRGAAGFVVVGGTLGSGWGTPTAVWAEGAWSAVRGYPAVVTKGEQRILHLSSPTEPANLWGAVVAEPFSMDPDTGLDDSDLPIPVADSAYTWRLDDLEPIRAAAFGATGLVIQTTAGEVVANGGGPDSPISPFSLKTRPASDAGGRVDRVIAPLVVGRETLLVDRTGRKLIALSFAFDLEAYRAIDRLRRSAHLVKTGTLVGLTRSVTPDPTLWAHTSDGRLLSCVYDEVEAIAGWGNQTPAPGAAGDVAVESVCIAPTPALDADEVWILVRRTINGQTVRSIERMNPREAVFLDSYLPYSGAPTTVLTGLDHLEGETVGVVGDGVYRGTAVVTGGQITVPGGGTVSQAYVGLVYASRLVTLPLGKPQELKGSAKVFVRCLDTQALTITGPGPRATPKTLAFAANEQVGMVDKDVTALGWDRQGAVTLEVTTPHAATVLAIGFDLAAEAA